MEEEEDDDDLEINYYSSSYLYI
jgi:hypothetical protein